MSRETHLSAAVAIDLVAVAEAVADTPEAVTRLAAALAPHFPAPASPYMTVPEAAEWLRCKRQRVDDLLSARRLTRYKDGRRTLVLRSEVEALLRAGAPARR